MKKIYTLLALLLLTLGSATAYADYAEGWNGKGIQSVSSPTTSITSGNYYIMYCSARNGYAAEGSNNQTTFGSYAVNSTDLAAVVKVTAVEGTDNGFTIQFASGAYLQPLTFLSTWGDVATTGTDAATFIIEEIGETNYFTVANSELNSDRLNSGKTSTAETLYLNGSESTPTAWYEKDTSGPGNGAYQFLEVKLGTPYTITYNFKDAEGNAIATQKHTVVEGNSYPSNPSVSGFYTTSTESDLSGTVSADGTYDFTLTYESDLPFTISSDAGDNAIWMGIQLRKSDWPDWNNFLAAMSKTDRSGVYSNPHNYNNKIWSIPTEAFTSYDDINAIRSWCITGDPINGFQFHNKWNGLVIATGSSVDNGENCIMTSSTAGSSTFFDIIKESNGKWSVKVHDGTMYLSDWGGQSQENLKFYNAGAGADDGSSFTFSTSIDALPAITNANIPSSDGLTKYVGEFNFWKEGISSMTETGEDLYNAIGKIAIESDTYYQIKSGVSAMPYPYFSSQTITANTEGSVTSGKMIRETANDAFVPQLWKFEKNEETGKYLIRNANTGTALGQHTGYGADCAINLLGTGADEYYAGIYNIVTGNYGTMQWMLQETHDGGVHRLNALAGANNDQRVVADWTYNDDTDSGDYWYIIPVTTIPLVIYSDTQYASAKYPFAVTLPEGLTAYVISATTGSEATLTAIGSQTVPANTPVLISTGEEVPEEASGSTTYTLTISSSTDTYSGTNLLDGATVKRTGFEESANYVLAAGPKLKSTGAVTTIPANKAYLPASNVPSSNAQALSLTFGETTGIEAVTNGTTDNGDAVYYDLNGRRVLYPVHGIFVKGNGQKVYIK